jgi:phage FluMu protein Com
MSYLTIPQLAKKYGHHPQTIYRLIKEGFPFKWKKVIFEVERKGYAKTKYPPRKVMVVSEEDWLEIPTYIRNKWRRGKNRLKVRK